ncbi:hypothetical protein CMO94_00080 [Candidatus Woesearchaeota archaeon]|jgi:hypothetical protein|nr:hypothetical protein [Candidatus Woesearchaeota archaeon]|tara:strand:- start:970 stop:1599 length:630 start_codon:yes stop_codon:yes gene_type:complete
MPNEQYVPGSKTPYGIYISEFDGWDYIFPILPPVRLGAIAANASSGDSPRATDRQWLGVDIVPEQREGYHSWVPTDDFILHMRPQHSLPNDPYAYVGRFSYEPESQEFLMGRLDQKHAATIDRFGNQVFNKYVRGIYLRNQRLILIRAYFNPLDEEGVFHADRGYDPEEDQEKTDKTLEMLLRNNLPPDISTIIRVDNEVVKEFDPLFI